MKPELKLNISPSKQIESMESKLREYRIEKTKLEDRITEHNNKLLDVVREHHISVRHGLLTPNK